MAYREKLAWISLVTTLLVFGAYGLSLISSDFARWIGGGDSLRLIGAVVVEIILASALAIAAAVSTPRDATAPVDEREEKIFARANSWGYGILSALIWMILLAGLYLGFDGHSLALGCLVAMIVSELIRSACQIIGFRRGA